MRMQLLLLMVGLALPAGVRAEDYQFATNGNAITISKYIGAGGAVTIPEKINGMAVGSIGDEAFWVCTNLTSVSMPASVTSIGNMAFGSCTNLTSIVLPNSVTNIGCGAFVECLRLKNAIIGNRVSSIGSAAFSYCISLNNLVIPNSVTHIPAPSLGFMGRL